MALNSGYTALSFLFILIRQVTYMDHLFFPGEDETVEELKPYGLKLLQKKNGFRFGMDSVLLAEFADIRATDRVSDFGTGSCVIPLLMIGRNKGKYYECIEIQKEIAEMAERTVSLNHLNNRIRIVCGDVKSVTTDIPICSFDAVVCNPPYTPPGTALASPISCRAISRTQETSTLSDFFSSAFRILKGKGKIFLIYPASGMLHIMNLLHQAHLEPKKFQLVYPYEHKPANLVLIEAVKDARPTLHPMPPLIVYKSGNELTDRLKSVYHIIGSCN